MLRWFFKWLSDVVGGFSAGFLAYVTLLGAVGLAIAGTYSAEATCWPHHSVLYVFETHCENKVADTAWWGTIELARFAVAMPALALYYLSEAMRETPYFMPFIAAFVWIPCALLVPVVWAGFRHWRARYPVVAWVLLTTFVGQAVVAALPVEMGTPVARTCDEAQGARYFPVGSFRGYPSSPGFAETRYAYHLAAMGEPSLWCGASQDTETYRFLWLRSFHDYVAVRIYRRGGVYGLEAVVLRQDEYEHVPGQAPRVTKGQVSKRVTKALSAAQWRHLLAALDEARFWHMRTTTLDLIGIDGADWVVEGRRAGQYHAASRHGASALWPVGNLFLELAGLGDIEPVY